MLKQLLTDFSLLFDAEYQPTTFQPYLSMILSIVFITIIGFSIQTVTTNVYTYAADPASMKTEIKQQTQTCTDFEGKFYLYLCEGTQQPEETNSDTNYFEHDLQSPIN